MFKPLKRTSIKVRSIKGFTLVELMIAMLLGLILIGAAIQVFLANRVSFTVNEGMARMQESSRFVMDRLAKDIRMAGYKGCFSLDMNIVNVADQDNDGVVDAEVDLSTSLAGYDYQSANTWLPALPAGIAPLDGTDVITISGVVDDGIRIADMMPAVSSELKVTDASTVDEDDIIFISDCTKGGIFSVTQVQVSSDHLQKNLTENTSKDLTDGSGENFGKDSSVYKVENKTYFVASSGVVTDSDGNAAPALWRRVNARAAEELVAGISDFEILYGEDTNSDDLVDRYVSADTLGLDMDRVVSIRFMLTASSVTDVQNGAPLSRSFSHTVKLRNRGA